MTFLVLNPCVTVLEVVLVNVSATVATSPTSIEILVKPEPSPVNEPVNEPVIDSKFKLPVI